MEDSRKTKKCTPARIVAGNRRGLRFGRNSNTEDGSGDESELGVRSGGSDRRRGGRGRAFGEIQLFHNAAKKLIRYLETHFLFMAILNEVVFERDELARIGHKSARGGELQVARAVVRLDPLTEKGLVVRHVM